MFSIVSRESNYTCFSLAKQIVIWKHYHDRTSTGQNPTGATLPLERRRAVYAIAQKYDIIIIEDGNTKQPIEWIKNLILLVQIHTFSFNTAIHRHHLNKTCQEKLLLKTS